MPFTPADIQANRDYFDRKLRAEKQRNDVLKAVEGTRSISLCSTRGREPFANAHIPGPDPWRTRRSTSSQTLCDGGGGTDGSRRRESGLAWGDIGHKIVCEIAFQELNDKARREVRGSRAAGALAQCDVGAVTRHQ